MSIQYHKYDYLRRPFFFSPIITNESNASIFQAKISNLKHRPIGIGIQGLADLFLLMKLPFESIESQKLNVQIFETLYYGALEASCELAEEYGPYESYRGSPISQGVGIIRIYAM